VALLDVDWNPDGKKLRQFSAILCLVGAAFAARTALRAGSAFPVVWCGVIAVGVLGIAWPALARPVYKVLLAVSLPIGWVMSHVLLLTVFYLVVTPIGLIMRLFGYDPLKRRFDPSAKTYFTRRERPPGLDRYFKQF
jgi:hypothetical protein